MSLRQTILTDSLYCLKNSIPQFITLTLSMVFLQYLLYSIFFSQYDLFNTTWSSFVEKHINSPLSFLNMNNINDGNYVMSDEEMTKVIQVIVDIVRFHCINLFTQLIIKSSIISGTLAIIYSLTKYDKTELMLVVKKTACYLPVILLIMFINQILIFIGSLFFILPGIFLLYALQLAPIIKIVDQTSVGQSLIRSIKVMFKNSFKLLPILLCFILINGVITSLALSIITVDTTVFFTTQLILVINTGFTIFLTIYLLRFYILKTKEIKHN